LLQILCRHATKSCGEHQHQNAVDAAIKYVGAKKYMWQDAFREQRLKEQLSDNKASYAPAAKLVWYNAGKQVSSPELRLAYKVDIYARNP
jgi:hypothetical protein